jgi:hypothetical protein
MQGIERRLVDAKVRKSSAVPGKWGSQFLIAFPGREIGSLFSVVYGYLRTHEGTDRTGPRVHHYVHSWPRSPSVGDRLQQGERVPCQDLLVGIGLLLLSGKGRDVTLCCDGIAGSCITREGLRSVSVVEAIS